MDDLISKQAAIEAATYGNPQTAWQRIEALPSAQPERLTDDDFETIRIHLNAYKEKLCNQQRWKEAEEYQRIIDRFMTFASAQPARKKGEWITKVLNYGDRGLKEIYYECSICNMDFSDKWNFCPSCGADMEKTDGK